MSFSLSLWDDAHHIVMRWRGNGVYLRLTKHRIMMVSCVVFKIVNSVIQANKRRLWQYIYIYIFRLPAAKPPNHPETTATKHIDIVYVAHYETIAKRILSRRINHESARVVSLIMFFHFGWKRSINKSKRERERE